MPCYHPIRVGVHRKSIFEGRRLEYAQEVPCGHCLGCRAEQGRQWAVRMIHEAQMHEFSWFATLTYSDKEMPDNASLCPEDFRGFVKRLRRRHPDERISYYGCGEYGGRTQRPHYHAVLFGAQFLDRYSDPDPRRDKIWRADSLDDAWRLGFAELGTVTMASASYVAGYVRKKMRAADETRADPITGEMLHPEFARMSRRPAVGRRWIEKFWEDVYPRDFVVVDGVEAKPPRYYDKWMDQHHPEMMEEVRQKRWDEAVWLEPSKLAAAEKIHTARNNLFAPRQTV